MQMPGFVGGAYESRAVVMAGERCVNVFPEMVPSGGKVRAGLVPAPGLIDFATMSDAPGRGIFTDSGRLFAVFGRTLYEIDSAGVVTSRGTVAVDANPVTMCTNGDGGGELFVTSGDTGYVLTLATNVLTNEVSAVTQAGQLDGYFVALDADTATVKISDSLDGTAWDPLQILQRSDESDAWAAMIISQQEVFLFGEKTGSVLYDKGTSPFPFALRPGGTFQAGIVAPFSLARFGQSMAWLGQTERGRGRVYQMDGYDPQVISTPAIDWIIATYNDDPSVGITDAVGWSYEREGHEFYVLAFPRAGRAWAYDATTRLWHERGKWTPSAGDYTAYRAQFHAMAFGKNLVCDPDGYKIYQLSSTTYTDAGGDELRRIRRTPHLAKENTRIFFPWAELECQRGVGNDDVTDPQVGLSYSNDGGNTWSDERLRSVGKVGEYDTRVRWEECGCGRDRVWQIASSDPAASVWLDLYVGAKPGRF